MRWVEKLLTIKSIVTLVLTVCFAGLSASGVITPDHFLTVYLVVIGFYFGTQFDKNSKKE